MTSLNFYDGLVLFFAKSLWHSHAPYLSGNCLPVPRLYPFLCGQATPSPPTKPGKQKNKVNIFVSLMPENSMDHNLSLSMTCVREQLNKQCVYTMSTNHWGTSGFGLGPLSFLISLRPSCMVSLL